MKPIITSIAFILCTSFLFSQNITAKLISKESKKPVQYANIKTGQYSGAISNEEGFFTIRSRDKTKTIEISCMGFKNKTLSIQEIKALGFVIKLDEAINQLSEVLITNKNPNAISILEKVRSKISENYDNNLNKYQIFHRNTDRVDFKSLTFEIDKASHVSFKGIDEANTALIKMSEDIKTSDMVHFKDFKGTLYNLNPDSSKIAVSKATKLFDYKNNFSIEDIQKKSQSIILKYLDTTKTYKLKTGLFKIEDSLSLKDDQFKELEKKEYDIPYLNTESRALLQKAQFYDTSFLDNVINPKLYEYIFEESTLNNGELTYIIRFIPRKSKSKYAGKLYVSEDTYAITRVDYSYYKGRHGEKLNLKLILGVKFIANVSEGMLLFEKNSRGKYHPKYLKQTVGAYFYVNRSLKFIENSRAKNKTNFDFKIEGTNRNKEELLFTSNEKITIDGFKAIQQDEIVPYTLLSTFKNTIWDDEDILEPLLEMKRFGGAE
ncbi:hypothetical protein GCM10023311_23690 [Flaviramulus aquimarinus]|uniref:Carboxypeptidase-like regulatory domain-containing protein n=1 Tax=Flaviramulus aquimarinus TaxID=1170456 RepID=A0ABP9FE38_9FLAO